MKRMSAIALLLLCASCGAPKYSYRSFPRPKYEVREHARNGTPSVRQTWWSRWWGWQRGGEREERRSPHRMRLR